MRSPRTYRRLSLTLLALITLAGLLSPAGQTAPPADAPSTHETAGATRTPAAVSTKTYAQLPMRFEANRGQADARVKFVARGSGYELFLTNAGAVLSLQSREGKGARDVLRMRLAGANESPEVSGLEELPGRSNYFAGGDPSKWRAGVPAYARVKYAGVYPGVDVLYYGNQRQLEYDFHVAPGATHKPVTLSFEGARRVRIDARGDLVLSTRSGETRMHKPFAYQETAEGRREVASRYVARGKGRVGFALGEYDRSLPLVIDPVLSYSTYFGGSGLDNPADIAVAADGSAYVAGVTRSADFPVTPGAYQTTITGSEFYDGFVLKLNPAGDQVVFATYLRAASINDIELDAAGNTASCHFDVTVRDRTAPAISCPAGIEIAGNIQGSCAANVEVGAPAASDSCSAVSVTGARGDGLALDQPYPQGTTVITWTAVDAYGNAASCQQHVTVTNPAPSVTINSPESGAVYAVGASVNFAGAYADNAGGTHSATWTFGDATQAGTVNEVTGSYVFTQPGVYSVKLRVEDGCGGAGEATTVGEFDAMVVVYDPAQGFVTGGGWINSQPGAYPAAPGAAGKANFGLVSKYLPAGGAPSGETEFQLKAGDLNFHSTAYEWLVVSGARAQYRGSGRVNNADGYGFIVTVLDGDLPGGDRIDRFRIKVWNKATGAVVYDNQPGAPNTTNPTAPLGGGQIVIHTH